MRSVRSRPACLPILRSMTLTLLGVWGIAALLFVWSPPRLEAESPTDKPLRPALTGGGSRPRLSAGEEGPFLSLGQLHSRAATNPERLLSRIQPPPLMNYPDALSHIPIAARSYSTETITYLAQHEIRYGDRKKPYVALTFDCEAGVDTTVHILDTLRQADVRATFFILGRYAYTYPDLMRAIAADGHEFGNHSFFHPLFYEISLVKASQEITYTEAALNWALGRPVPMRYFRFPFAGKTDELRQHVASLGYQSAFWDMDPRGWEPNVTAEDVVNYVRYTVHSGGIIIMHCSCWDDVNALPDMIQIIRERGWTPGMLSDVLTAADRDVPKYTPPGQSNTSSK